MVTLENSKLGCRLSAREAAELLQVAREQSFPARAVIFEEGQTGDGLYVVREGSVEISVRVGQDGRHVFSNIEPGDFFGEMAVLDEKARSATATASAATTVYFLPRPDVLGLVERSPGLAFTLLREISNRLREFNHQYLREVLQAERLAVVGRFARSIIHDLKNPLNNIGLVAEVAGMSQIEPETRDKAVQTIRRQVERISEMVGEILEFTQGAPQDLVLPPINYARFVEQVIDEIRPEAALKALLISLENPVPDVSVVLNPKRLRRVFNNLIQNAGEAMPDGGKLLLRFTLRPTEVVTEFEDSGPGVAPEMAGMLFQAFATHGKSHGTGLGLSICKRILEDHRGWIVARHEPGRGAIFQFGLPLAAPAA